MSLLEVENIITDKTNRVSYNIIKSIAERSSHTDRQLEEPSSLQYLCVSPSSSNVEMCPVHCSTNSLASKESHSSDPNKALLLFQPEPRDPVSEWRM